MKEKNLKREDNWKEEPNSNGGKSRRMNENYNKDDGDWDVSVTSPELRNITKYYKK